MIHIFILNQKIHFCTSKVLQFASVWKWGVFLTWNWHKLIYYFTSIDLTATLANMSIQFFSSFEVGNRFGMKDPIPRGLRTCEVHKFLYAGCNACYVGETSRHLSTRVREHLVSYRTSHSFRHLPNSQQCCILCSDECFSILDHASATLPLKIKEAIHS